MLLEVPCIQCAEQRYAGAAEKEGNAQPMACARAPGRLLGTDCLERGLGGITAL